MFMDHEITTVGVKQKDTPPPTPPPELEDHKLQKKMYVLRDDVIPEDLDELENG